MNMIETVNNLIVKKAYAASLGDSLNNSITQLQNGSVTDTSSLVQTVVNIAVPLSVICVIALAVYGGYILMTSQGNPDKLQEGKEVITNAVIGFIVIILCVAILLLISNTLGLGIYN